MIPGVGATVEDLIEDTKSLLYSHNEETLNRLDGALNSSAITVACDFPTDQVAEKSYIGIGIEMMYVWDVSSTGLTVQRGARRSTADDHSDGDIIEIAPRFPRFDIYKALRDEIRSWPPDLYAIYSFNVTGGADDRGYDLTGGGTYSAIVDVSVAPATGDDTDIWRPVTWREDPFADTSLFTSGRALFIDTDPGETRNIRVSVARQPILTTWDLDTDVEDDIGLLPTMLDIATHGAAARLLRSREVPRTAMDGQGEPRRSEEVPPGHILQTAAEFDRFKRVRISEEIRRLREKYPIR